jgi:hypothetical protein
MMKNGNNLIGISGKINSGKDTVGRLIQILTSTATPVTELLMQHMLDTYDANIRYTNELDVFEYQIKKYADKLKDIVCLLIGCTRADLEDREFKEKELGEEWWYWKVCIVIGDSYQYRLEPYNTIKEKKGLNLIKLTPRKLLQLLGTECGRRIIHPNIWVNALFADYQEFVPGKILSNGKRADFQYRQEASRWIITDVRFPNEAQAIKARGGLLIRVNRDVVPVIGETYTLKDRFGDEIIKDCVAEHDARGYDAFTYLGPDNLIYRDGDYVIVRKDEHESETALDSYEGFDHVIENSGTIEELVEKVKKIL